MHTNWQHPQTITVSADLLTFTGDPLLAQLLARRGITTPEQARAFLDPDSYQPAPATDLPDIDAAVSRLNRAIEWGEQILVWGDFDVDGQTSTALLVSALQNLGGQVSYYIPNRLTESHGIKTPALRKQLAAGVDVLLTCDTGIAEFEAVEIANAAGTDVIITDHHDLADRLPPAHAVINPKRLPTDHPLHELPGVGVAFKLVQALCQSHNRSEDADALLDLVALGIVADVARQTGDTRYLLQRGLAVLQETRRVGLHALFESANLKTEHPTEDHIGFWLAPRMNALGRLGDANLAVELLTTTDLTRARTLALQLEALNDRRKLLVDRVVVQALGQLEDTPSLAEYNAIVLAAADWHPGVIGIAASRLVEQYGKPAILIALRPDGLGRGSARSVAGCDIHQAIKSQANLLVSFGGHPMAAGLALAPENVATFRRGVSQALAGCQPDTETVISLDAMVDLPQISFGLLSTIQKLAPFGAGNPAVKLGCTGLTIAGESTFGKGRAHKRVTVEDEQGNQQEFIWWRGATERSPQGQFDLAFTLGPDDYKGGDAVQAEWLAAREWVPAPVSVKPEFVDWRESANSELQIANLQMNKLANEQIGKSQIPHPKSQIPHPASHIANPKSKIQNLKSKIVWSEGVDLPELTTFSRHALHPAENLIIWTAPPGEDIFRQAMAAVNPRQVYLVGQPSPLDAFEPFVQRLLGLIKYALTNKDGELDLDVLAAALGHRVVTVRMGIDWLVAQGRLSIYAEEENLRVVRPAKNPPQTETVTVLEEILKSTLAETAAYRRFFREASLASLQKILV